MSPSGYKLYIAAQLGAGLTSRFHLLLSQNIKIVTILSPEVSQSKVLNPTDEHYKDLCYQKGMQGREQSFLRGPRCVKSFGLRQTFLPQLARRGHFPSRSLTKWQRVHSHPIEKAGELLYIINQCRVLVKLKVPHKIFPCSPCHQYI